MSFIKNHFWGRKNLVTNFIWLILICLTGSIMDGILNLWASGDSWLAYSATVTALVGITLTGTALYQLTLYFGEKLDSMGHLQVFSMYVVYVIVFFITMAPVFFVALETNAWLAQTLR